VSTTEPRPVASVTDVHGALELALPFADREDFEDAQRGFLGELSPGVVTGTEGRVVWSLEGYDFLAGERPETVNPSLWRQAQLLRFHGLFEVVPGIYQVRGLDLSNMTLVEGDDGVIVIDPLISSETAAAALALYRAHRGDRPVTGLIYTHSHIDHFGGARGVLDAAHVEAGRVPVLAPEGFLQHAVSENVYAGPAMARRASYMFGALLEPGPSGQVTCGLGHTTSTGSITLIPPTQEIARSGEQLTLDGVRMEFQLTPNTEAPAEMNFLFPDRRALCIAENATHNLHNVITPRGALVRDARNWAGYLDEAIRLFGDRADAMFAGHQWPRWGRERIVDMLAKQRDLYAYLHDQTLRLINKGHTPKEIAEELRLPPSLEREWHCRGYYGSVSHNVKGIYQRYMGWFDGNPAHLWEHPPVEAAKRYVDFMGGADAVLEKARAAFEAGDLRWVAEVVNHVVFADPGNAAARELQAAALDQLGYGAENAPWRNFFLTGAKELREGVAGTAVSPPPADIVAGLTCEQLFDSMAIRLDGPRAFDVRLALTWVFPDLDATYSLILENAVLTHRRGAAEAADATITLNRTLLDRILTGGADLPQEMEAGALRIEGDGAKLGELLSLFDAPDPSFAIVTP
jgi:alkyl sulfatase BDS1-like metallo-beta-lactamase superfamily hydrolase